MQKLLVFPRVDMDDMQNHTSTVLVKVCRPEDRQQQKNLNLH